MKKSILSLMGLALIAGSVFTGCKKDNEDPTQPTTPTVSIATPSGGSITVAPGDSVHISGIASASDGRKLKSIKVQVSVNDGAFQDVAGSEVILTNTPTTYSFDEMVPTMSVIGKIAYKIIATDDKDVTGSGTVTITVAAGNTNLGSATASEWKRIGAAAGTGVSTVGLSWTSNVGSSPNITANVVPGSGNKLVMLSLAEWTSITTEAALKTAVDNGTSLTSYNGVDADANDSSINEVIATKVGTKYYLILVKSSTVSSGGAGTTVTVQTEYKATL